MNSILSLNPMAIMIRFFVIFSPACAQTPKIARGDFYPMVKKLAKNMPDMPGTKP
jgi:hypothetical protein